MKKILILGPIPATAGIGGVTIHVQRLLEWLEARGIAHTLGDYKALSFKRQLRLIMQHKSVHLHVSHPVLRIMYALLIKLMGKKLVFTVHGNLGRFSWFGNLLDKWTVMLSDIPVTINQLSYDKALKWNKRTQLISAFIPPIEDGEAPEWALKKIDDLRTKRRRLFSTNASACSFTPKGDEIYGIEFLIDFFRHRDEVLVISDPSGQYAEKHKGENLFIIAEPHSTYAIYKHVDGTIRNTATDGDSISVRESLYLGLPTYVTDRVDRPEGCILFHYNDAESLSKALKEKRQATKVPSINPIDQIIDLYKNL